MSGKMHRATAVDDQTIFRVPVDDETMPLLLEQAEAAGCPPPLLLSIIVRDVLAHAKAEGLTLAMAMPGPSNRH